MALPLLPGKLPRTDTDGPRHIFNEADSDALSVFVEQMMLNDPGDACGAVERFAEARGIFAGPMIWRVACQTVGITQAFRRSLQITSAFFNDTWFELFREFCANMSPVPLWGRLTTPEFNNTAVERSRMWFKAQESRNFASVALMYRDSVSRDTLMSLLLVFHTGGRYQWREAHDWALLDEFVSNYWNLEDGWISVATLLTAIGDAAAPANVTPVEAYRRLLDTPGIDVNNSRGQFNFPNTPPDWRAETALIYAAAMGRLDLLAMLLDHPNIHIDSFDRARETALYWALARRQLDAARMLLDRGADVLGDMFRQNALPVAVGITDPIFIERLVNAAYKLDMSKDKWRTIDMWQYMARVENGHYFLLPLLKYIRVDARNPDGLTALMRASREGHIEAIDLLLRAGADVNHADNGGSTALMHASSEGQMAAVVRLLQESNIDTALENDQGETAAEIALMNGHGEITALIVEH